MSDEFLVWNNHQLSEWDGRIDVVCDRFAAELKRGSKPRIEDSLDFVPPAARSALLRELLTVEVDFLRQRSKLIDFSGYYVRFPNERSVVNQVYSECKQRDLHSGVTRSISDENSATMAVEVTQPRLIKHFQLCSIVGRGGFGIVWRAFDTKLQREVAVKIPRTDRFDNVDLSAVLKEARASAMLRHPGVVTVYEVGEGDQDSPAYIVTDFIDGPNLKTWFETRRCTPRQVAELTCQIARALEHAHGRGIIHRDLKPANVLLDSQDRPHLADFGLAKRSSGDEATSTDNRLFGTPAYMSPEQTRFGALVDHRSDLYSLGVVLYELLTGERPFRGTQEELFDQIARSRPKPPRQLQPTVPEDLEKICLKCLEKNPVDRYQSAKDLADDLERSSLGRTPRGVTISRRGRFTKWIFRNRLLGLGLVASLCMGAAVMTIGMRWSSPAVFRQQVLLDTDPPGCELTVVRIDPETGNLDATKRYDIPGRTPLKARLIPGDYFVVAVLKSSDASAARFHEVVRHIPDQSEQVPMAGAHNFWRIDNTTSSVILRKIKIPPADVTKEMALIAEGVIRENEIASAATAGSSTQIHVPAFFADRSEASDDELVALRNSGSPTSDFPPLASVRFDEAMSLAEKLGKRLPFASELALLEMAANNEVENPSTSSPDDTPPRRQMEGVKSLLWEWTMTRAGGAGAGLPSGRMGSLGTTARVIRNGPSGSSNVYGLGFAKIQLEHRAEPATGFRMVRSAKPSR